MKLPTIPSSLFTRPLAAALLLSTLASCVVDPDAAPAEDVETDDALGTAESAVVLPPAVFLSQTPTKDQHDRGTCWAFGIVGAIEAAYKRKYGITLDLSEQYLFHIVKSSEYIPTKVPENNSSLWGFQGSSDILGYTSVLRLPEEGYAAYKTQGQLEAVVNNMPAASSMRTGGTPTQAGNDVFEQSQDVVPIEAGYHARYGATSTTRVAGSASITDLQEILASQHEIVADFAMRRKTLPDGSWDFDGAAAVESHVMLIVGYDRNARTFTIKNSWGEVGTITVTYAFMANCFLGGGYVNDVVAPNTPDLNQPKWLGRWTLSSPGLSGNLFVRRYADTRNNLTLADGVSQPLGALYATDGSVQPVTGWFSNGGSTVRMLIGGLVMTFPVAADHFTTTGDVRSLFGSPVGTATLTREGYWDHVPACVKAIGIGPDGDNAWVLGCTRVGGGYEIYKRVGGGWALMPGGAVRIAVEKNTGNPWVTNDAGSIFEWSGGHWVNRPGCARDIAAGADRNNVWVIGCGASGAGQDLFQYAPARNDWDRNGQGAFSRVAVSPAGKPWALGADGRILWGERFLFWNWNQVPGCATSIAVGGDELPWVIGCGTTGPAGGSIFHRSVAGVWELVAGTATQIGVSRDGLSRWVTTSADTLFRRTPPFRN